MFPSLSHGYPVKNNEVSEVIPKVVVGGESGYHVKKERYGCRHQHKKNDQNRKQNMISVLFLVSSCFVLPFGLTSLIYSYWLASLKHSVKTWKISNLDHLQQ